VEYTDKGAVCADTQRHSGTLSRAVEVSGQVVNMKKPGTYTIRYDCQDDSGNQAVPKTRTIVVADHSCPEIKMLGDQINYVEAGFPYVDAAATATDDLDGDITSAIQSDGDTINVAGAFASLGSCSEIKASFCHIKGLVDANGLPSDECEGTKGPNTGNYFITTKVTGGAFTRQNVWCDFTSDSKLAYTYYPCSGCAQAKRDGSEQGDCASIGLEMASVHTTGAKRKFDKKFWEDDNSSSEYLCSTNDQASVITPERLEHITNLNPNLAHAEAGTFVIDYYVQDSSKNAQCSSPKRTVIVRDTLPPVISLHLDDKLIHVSDATKLGLGNGADKNAKAVNRAGDPTYNAALKDNVKDMLMSEQGSTTNNVWLLAAAASAVTGLALLSATSKRAPVSVPV